MAYLKKILMILLFLSCLSTTFSDSPESETSTPTKVIEEEELIESESKDGKLEIIKRIKKVNPDGSYTIGYEADDGSFKIESRDVLGNIKGTYGFLDEEGAIKRISYSSSNATDIFSKHEPPTTPSLPTFQSVVQRIQSKTTTTKKPSSVTTTSGPSSTTFSVIQSISRRRTSSTTPKPNESFKSSPRPDLVVYTSATPRVLLQRPSTAASVRLRNEDTKSEGQIIRPEVNEKSTEVPVFKTLHAKHYEDEKPVTEDASEIKPNILRRQLPQTPKQNEFSPQEHVYNLRQSLGHNDVSDVFNSGHTVTSRPLFTTTRANRIPVTTIPVANYQRSETREVDSAAYSHPRVAIETTSVEPVSTSTNRPVVQIPANRGSTPEPLVAIRHPFQQGAILVPLSQLQNKIIPVDNMQEVYDARAEIERANIRKVPQPLPVQVDEHGYVRPRQIPVPVPVAQSKQLKEEELSSNDIESVQPPVSTREFQMLLNHLILRQKKLERISELVNSRQYPEMYQREPVKYQRVVEAPSRQYVYQRSLAQEYEPQGAYFSMKAAAATSKSYTYSSRNEDTAKRFGYQRRYVENNKSARLIPVRDANRGYYQDESEPEEYLPVEVRETLLLRMLQLAINPALPVEDEEEEGAQVATVNTPKYRRPPPVRNVEILGEERDDRVELRKGVPVSRAKRFKDEDMDYME
ncbi:uncharacterized protein LOC126745239 [Anthonomus grandis grandis]|uniref:uncharacterized protein LOC126745239 n=1 Tax=Anthonomus grandis grandis TaxID=2921223 RepID=UPI0021661EF1|nr:uncharacterized protein LOC126745239 [Anthonomus grandis grandis]